MNANIINYLENLTLLYAEDDITVQKNVLGYLELLFKDIIIAKDGEEAYELYYEKRPDIILTDIDMPKMSGIEFIKKVREYDTATPAIILSAHTNTDYLLDAVELHVTKYILKPFVGDNFIQAIENIYESSNKTLKINDELSYSYLNKTLMGENSKQLFSKKESRLFELLLDHPEALVTYSEIENHVWCDYEDVMTSENLRTLIKGVRKKLPPETIKNISGTGYVFTLKG
ncbi:MAG: response regulator [Campylobacterota bacterium]|nr:response regulator [Campylobacterota bacterium]